MRRYEMTICWSRDDEAFVVEVPELPGCMADGQTFQEAVANAETIVEEWLETARELERPVPPPKGEQVVGVPLSSVALDSASFIAGVRAQTGTPDHALSAC